MESWAGLCWEGMKGVGTKGTRTTGYRRTGHSGAEGFVNLQMIANLKAKASSARVRGLEALCMLRSDRNINCTSIKFFTDNGRRRYQTFISKKIPEIFKIRHSALGQRARIRESRNSDVESSRDADADVRPRSPPVAGKRKYATALSSFYHDLAKVNSKLEITIHGDIEFILESSSLLTASLSTSGQRRIHGAMDVTAFLGRILLTSSN
ncbi:hypothetical protein EVAR_81366_1 [Eumeta japonica]|uniref:Uncharacterized protein n=1 Tax=Eumeta variegata TaxID=151549 RepID=A0A4C2AAL3_EUMVA|nr:hypothetical protein EVAR_81366_1 [Eumeta japonica]